MGSPWEWRAPSGLPFSFPEFISKITYIKTNENYPRSHELEFMFVNILPYSLETFFKNEKQKNANLTNKLEVPFFFLNKRKKTLRMGLKWLVYSLLLLPPEGLDPVEHPEDLFVIPHISTYKRVCEL